MMNDSINFIVVNSMVNFYDENNHKTMSQSLPWACIKPCSSFEHIVSLKTWSVTLA